MTSLSPWPLSSPHTVGGSEKVRADAVRNKMSELHVNCQLLVKQITGIKAAASAPEVNVKALSELSDLLVTSCDAFLNVLHECMDLSMPAQAMLTPVNKVMVITCSSMNSSE